MSSEVTVIKGGTVIDESGSRVADVVIADGVIRAVEANADTTNARVIDADGCVVSPGLVDIHTHLREPGREEAETVETGSRAAALGGYAAVVAMPNTEPTIDCVEVVEQVQRAARNALCDVAVSASITVDRAGERLTPFAELAARGVRLLTDDGSGVQDARLMQAAFEQSIPLGLTLAQHCEDSCLSHAGQMNDGPTSQTLGIVGIPHEAEEVMVMRDIALARKTGARIHFLHLSTVGSVALVAAAKAEGLPVTAEAAPHHFTLTEEEVLSLDPAFKVNPPLRTEGDRQAVRLGLIGRTIDAIATDHAPHTRDLKQLPFNEAPCGMLGLETALALAITELEMPIEQVLALMSWQPARIAGLDSEHGSLGVGRAANVCVIDPEAWWVVEPEKLSSKARNTPYVGRKLQGRVRHTIHRGEVVVRDGAAQR